MGSLQCLLANSGPWDLRLVFAWDKPASVEEFYYFQACFWRAGMPWCQHPSGDVQYSGNGAHHIFRVFFLILFNCLRAAWFGTTSHRWLLWEED